MRDLYRYPIHKWRNAIESAACDGTRKLLIALILGAERAKLTGQEREYIAPLSPYCDDGSPEFCTAECYERANARAFKNAERHASHRRIDDFARNRRTICHPAYRYN